MTATHTTAFCALLALTLLTTACDQVDVSKLSDEDMARVSEHLIACEAPYMRHGAGCCLDQNANRVCDTDEASPSQTGGNGTLEPQTPTPDAFVCPAGQIDVYERWGRHECVTVTEVSGSNIPCPDGKVVTYTLNDPAEGEIVATECIALQHQAPTCGNGVCDVRESCDTCTRDCACARGESCSMHRCTAQGAEQPQDSPDQETPTYERFSVPLETSDHSQGSGSVIIVEYADFACPFSRDFHEHTLPTLLKEYGEDVTYVYRHYPLEREHPEAMNAAIAAECAAAQGKFWEMHDLLFTRQAYQRTESYHAWARELNLDTIAFNTCLESQDAREKVLQDIASAQDLDVTGTPTFFINGRKITGNVPYAELSEAVQDALNDATA